MARSMYDNFLTEEQHKLWPDVPDIAQEGGFDEALAAEREKIYPGLRDQANKEAKEEIAAYKINRIATHTKQIEESVQREEADVLRIAAHKLGYDLAPIERVPRTIKRSRDEPSAPKKPKSETAKAAIAATIPTTGSKRTAEVKVHTPATPKALLHPTPGDKDHPMVIADSESDSIYTNSDRFETRGVVIRLMSRVSEESTKAPTEPPLPVIKMMTEHLPLNEDVVPLRSLRSSTHGPEGTKETLPPPLPTDVIETNPEPAPPMAVDSPEIAPVPAPTQDALSAILAAVQGFQKEQMETRKDIAKLGERITAVERGERIPQPKPVSQTKPSTPKSAPPVSILKRPQPAAVPTPPPKAVAKDIPPHLPAAKATTEPQPVNQGKANGSPSTIPVTQTPTVPKPLEGETKDAGSHIISPAVGADAEPEPVKGRVDDDEEFPALPTREPGTTSSLSRNQRRRAARFQKALIRQMEGPPGSNPPPPPPTSKPRTNDDGFIQVQGRVRPQFAVVTQSGVRNATTSRTRATAAGQTQGRQPNGKPLPNTTRPSLKAGTTEVVVIRNKGFKDPAKELAIRQRPEGAIAREVQSLLNTKTAKPLKILSGKWSSNYAVTGNFVYTLVGELPMAHIQTYQTILTTPFGDCKIVTTRGWNWANLKDVLRQHPETGVVWEESELITELRSNPMFSKASISVPPYWLGNPYSFQGDRGTIVFAYEDLDNKITQTAITNGVAMFGSIIRFVPMGDVPVALQCGRCWQMGHRSDWPECRIPGNEVICFRCGGKHSGGQHDYACTGTHAILGKCNCILKCLLCKSTQHNARSWKCPNRKGAQPVLPAPLRPVGWTRSRPVNPGMGPPTHQSTEPAPKQTKPKAGSNALAKNTPLDNWTKGMLGTKAAMEAAGETFSEEQFAAAFPKPVVPATTPTPLIPFIGISEEAFYEAYEGHDETLPVPAIWKLKTGEAIDRWDADVLEGTTLITYNNIQYTARIEDLALAWHDVNSLEITRLRLVTEGDMMANRAFLKPSYRSQINAELSKSPAFCATNPNPGFTGGFLKPRALPCLSKNVKHPINDFMELPYA